MQHIPRSVRRTARWTAWLALALAPLAGADEIDSGPDSLSFLASIQESEALQSFLDTTIEELRGEDTRLAAQEIRVSLLDIPATGVPRLAAFNGDSAVYPASVPKFVYLMATYAWRDEGRLEIDTALDRQLRAMVYSSSNSATQHVLRRLTKTEAGPRLSPEAYRDFAWRRHAVKRWLQLLGIGDLHLVHPTYNGGGDLYGRDLQFLEDKFVKGCLPDQQGPYFNRQGMTASGTARLLGLLAEDLAFSPETSAEVRERMRRDTRKQPYLRQRIAGGVEATSGTEVFSKTGTWGPIYADAGIIRHSSGHQLVVVAFLEGRPAYRGAFIAKLTRAAAQRLLPGPASAANDRPRSRVRRDAAPG